MKKLQVTLGEISCFLMLKPLMIIYNGMSLLYLKNHKNEQNKVAPETPVINSTHLNAEGELNIDISKFIPNIPATTP